jgi:hypothetical protein
MSGDRTRCPDGGWGGRVVHPTHKFERMWPKKRGIRIEAEHELRLTAHDAPGQAVPKAFYGSTACG